MTKNPKGSTWVTVDTRGGVGQVSAPEAHPERPSRLEGLNYVKVDAPTVSTMPSCQLVVASLADAASLESARAGAEPFRWSELRTVDASHLAMLRCLDDDTDPSTLLEPIEEERNPFTGEVSRRTVFRRSFETFEAVVGGELFSVTRVTEMAMDGALFDDAVLLRLPPPFVTRIAQMSEAAITETARNWARAWSALTEIDRRGLRPLAEDDARRDLDVLVSTAHQAVAAKHELFLWMAA